MGRGAVLAPPEPRAQPACQTPGTMLPYLKSSKLLRVRVCVCVRVRMGVCVCVCARVCV